MMTSWDLRAPTAGWRPLANHVDSQLQQLHPATYVIFTLLACFVMVSLTACITAMCCGYKPCREGGPLASWCNVLLRRPSSRRLEDVEMDEYHYSSREDNSPIIRRSSLPRAAHSASLDRRNKNSQTYNAYPRPSPAAERVYATPTTRRQYKAAPQSLHTVREEEIIVEEDLLASPSMRRQGRKQRSSVPAEVYGFPNPHAETFLPACDEVE